MRRTKILCTLGPASDSPEIIEAMVQAGMDAARLNFSHGTAEEHARRAGWVREAARKLGRPVGILQDLQGPKLRVGRMRGGRIQLAPGKELSLTTEDVEGTEERISTDYRALPRDVRPGDRILLADGLLSLEVISTAEREVRVRVVHGGELGDRKGLNLPDTRVSLPALTDKDREDLEVGRRIGVDGVALSFVQGAADLAAARAVVGEPTRGGIPLLAKLERPAAIEHLEEILAAADGVMIARGDLGVELPLQRVPIIQKDVIDRTQALGKHVITATQMLESMTRSPTPTRAEVSDVANAVFDGSDAVMLSGETAAGAWPVEAVRTMAAIIEEVESSERYQQGLDRSFKGEVPTHPNAIAHAAVQISRSLGIDTLVVFTETGRTAQLVSDYRPDARIIAFSPHEATRRRMSLFWGVQPAPIEAFDSTDAMFEAVDAFLPSRRLAAPGDLVLLVAGVPPGKAASTNLIKIHRLA